MLNTRAHLLSCIARSVPAARLDRDEARLALPIFSTQRGVRAEPPDDDLDGIDEMFASDPVAPSGDDGAVVVWLDEVEA